MTTASDATTGRRRFTSPLRPFELVAFAGALATFGFLRANGLRFGGPALLWSAEQVIAGLPLIVGSGLAAHVVARLVRREPVRPYLREIASGGWLWLWCRLWLANIAVFYAYVWLKVSIPLVRTALFDPELWRLDRALHFGIAPTVLAVELTRGTVLPTLLDLWYALWVPSVPIAFGIGTAALRADVRRNFVLANSLLWVAGAWLYLAMPALGPCYANPEVGAPVIAEMPKTETTQRALFAHYGKMIESRGRVLSDLSPSHGVAAMPSLHVAAHALFAIWAWRHRRRLALPLALATALTFFASLVTTWHYAIDGYAGILLAWLAVRVADRWDPISEPESTSGSATARESGEVTAPESPST